jgi:predicted DNA-binding protein (UPF0251 family)
MRPKIERKCRHLDNDSLGFRPVGVPMFFLEEIKMSIDEFEAIRLCDFEGKSQVEASEIMGVSRRTFQRALKSGRYKVSDFLLNQKFLKIINTQNIEKIEEQEIENNNTENIEKGI